MSLNQYTTNSWSLRGAAAGCRRAGLNWIGLWRDKVAEAGLDESGRILQSEGLRCSGVCRGGWFPAGSVAERQERIDDNFKAVDECAALKCDTLVLVCGGPHSKDIEGARRMVEEGIAAVAPYAAQCGVRLGIEPLHPMFAGDRSVVGTLGQSLDIAEAVGAPNVGVIIDVYHVWWDPALQREIARAGRAESAPGASRLMGFHLCDWLVPTKDLLLDRGNLR